MNLTEILCLMCVMVIVNVTSLQTQDTMNKSFLISAIRGADEETRLQLLQIVFRHGDRTPVTIYPNDIYKEPFWDMYGGLGQLTQTGMQQHYEFGNFLRQRYGDFLNKTYDRNLVYVRSTDYDRTIMSAASMLTSLYKPEGYQVWNKDIAWQPIPIHTSDNDKIFSNMDTCVRYQELKMQVTDTDEYKMLSNKYQDVIDAAIKEGGFQTMTLLDMWKLSDDVFVQKSHNLSLPQWIVDKYDKLMELRDVDFYLDFRTPEMAKIAGGGIVNEMNKNIIKTLNNKGPKSLQLVLFSSHDTYVAGITKLFNMTSPIRQPPYASAVVFELRKSLTTSQYYIQVFTKNNTADEEITFRPATIFGCQNLCPLETFQSIIQDKIVDDFSLVCRSQKQFPLNTPTLMLTIGFVGLIGFVASLMAIRSCQRSIRNDFSYERQQL